jgi:DNA mismatch endonuclease (patch repair protein)
MERLLRSKLPMGAFDKVLAKHSNLMKRVRGRGNRTTELRLRSAMIQARLNGWKMHSESLVGHPDFYFPALKLVVFVDGCFWHGCPKCGHVPSKHTEYWRAKFRRNRFRDQKITRGLRTQGMMVIRFWEHDVQENLHSCIAAILGALRKQGQTAMIQRGQH